MKNKSYTCNEYIVQKPYVFLDVTLHFLLPGGEYLYNHPVVDDKWKKDEILEAKIKKFLSVSYTYFNISFGGDCEIGYIHVGIIFTLFSALVIAKKNE